MVLKILRIFKFQEILLESRNILVSYLYYCDDQKLNELSLGYREDIFEDVYENQVQMFIVVVWICTLVRTKDRTSKTGSPKESKWLFMSISTF